MKRDAILRLFRSLANSQGFYGRLLRDIYQDPEYGEELLSQLEAMNFTSELDVILAIEG